MIWNHPYRHAYNKQSNEAKLTFVGLVESLCPTLQGPGSSLYLTLKGFYLKLKKNIGLYFISDSKVKSDKHWSEVPPARGQSQRGDHHDGRLPHFPRRPRKAAGIFSQSGK